MKKRKKQPRDIIKAIAVIKVAKKMKCTREYVNQIVRVGVTNDFSKKIETAYYAEYEHISNVLNQNV